MLINDHIFHVRHSFIPYRITIYFVLPNIFYTNYRNPYWAKIHLTTRSTSHKTHPTAVLHLLHGHRRIKASVCTILRCRHLPLRITVVHILVHPLHTHIGQVKWIVFTNLKRFQMTINYRTIVHINLYYIAESRVTIVNDSKTYVIVSILQMIGCWFESMERPVSRSSIIPTRTTTTCMIHLVLRFGYT